MIEKLIIWYFAGFGVFMHFYMLYKQIQSDCKKPQRYCINSVPKEIIATGNNPRPAKKFNCACCDTEQWVEESSEAYLCSACMKSGCDLGGM